jgi:prolyl 4-hydroxylase
MQPFRPEGFHNVLEKLQKTEQYTWAVEGGGWDPGVCDDRHKKCAEWAAAGECDKNPTYMRGANGTNDGNCRKSCKVCQDCKPGDRDCYRSNREAAGYLDLKDEVRQLTGMELKQP